MKVIAFTGMPWSGKTEAVKIAREIGLPVIRMGDMIWEEVEKQGLPINSENVGRIADEMRRKYGRDIWARKTLDKIRSIKTKDAIIIDGIRSLDEINYFKNFFKEDFILIAIIASDEIRRSRALARKRKDDTDNLNDIIGRDERERKWGLPLAIEKAEYIISNDNTLELFQERIRKLIMEIVKR